MNNHAHNRYGDMDSENNNGRAIALFPGAYGPPHAGHYHAVIDLACRKEFDEVVIIISNRNRNLPDTPRVLGPEVAEKIWSLYINGMSKVRVKVAASSAVRQALAYFEVADGIDKHCVRAIVGFVREYRNRLNKIHPPLWQSIRSRVLAFSTVGLLHRPVDEAAQPALITLASDLFRLNSGCVVQVNVKSRVKFLNGIWNKINQSPS